MKPELLRPRASLFKYLLRHEKHDLPGVNLDLQAYTIGYLESIYEMSFLHPKQGLLNLVCASFFKIENQKKDTLTHFLNNY